MNNEQFALAIQLPLCCMAFLMFDLVCSITSGIMDVNFAAASDVDSSCKVMGIPAFLIAGGSGNFAPSILHFYSPRCLLSILQLLFNLHMIVYRSLVAFGKEPEAGSGLI